LRLQHKPARKMQVSVTSTVPCVLAVAQPPAINFDKVRQKADFNYLLTFRSLLVAVSRSQPYTPEKGAPVLWWLSVTATPPPSHKKTKKNGFFAPLGCLFYSAKSC
jgi:hypothetical protein